MTASLAPSTAKNASAFLASATSRMKPRWIPLNKFISQKPFCVQMFSPSSYRTPVRSPFRTPRRRTFLNTPAATKGWTSPRLLSPATRATTMIRRSPKLRGFARTGGAYGRFQPSGVESKYADISLNLATLPSGVSWGFTSVNQIPVSDGPSGRIGRSVTLTSIQLMYNLDLHHTETNVVYMRLMVVLDKQCNGAAPAYVDLMNANSALAYRNLDNADRFVVLHDKFIRYTPSALSAPGSMRFSGPTFVQVYRKCNIPIVFDNSATTGALATIRSNNVFVVGYLYGATTNLNDLKGILRVRYRDD